MLLSLGAAFRAALWIPGRFDSTKDARSLAGSIAARRADGAFEPAR